MQNLFKFKQLNHLLISLFFSPKLAGPNVGPSEEQARDMIKAVLTNNSKFAVWPTATPPPGLPPLSARPIVQWFTQRCGAAHYECPGSPHVTCCRSQCNFDEAIGNFVQRAHGKVRYEGMAIPGNVDQTDATVPLFWFDCTPPGVSIVDHVLAPWDWQPTDADGGPCSRIEDQKEPEMWIWPHNVTNQSGFNKILNPLEMWYKAASKSSYQDHYVVGCNEGRTDAIANGYTFLR